MFGRRLGGRRAEQRVERLEEHVGRGDERDAADAEALRPAPRPRRQRDRVAELRLQRRGELLVEHDLARPQRAAQEAEGLRCVRGSRAGRRGSSRRRSGSCPRPRACSTPGERRGRGRRRPAATPGWRATPAATPRAPRRSEPTGPCQSSGTLRTALPVIVRSEWPTKSSIAPSSATAAASDERRAQRSARARARARRARAATARSRRDLRRRRRGRRASSTCAVEPGRDVGVVRGDRRARSRTRRCSASIRSSTRSPVSESRWPVGSSQSSSSRLLRERARDRDALRLAAGELRRQVVGLRRRARPARAAPAGACRVGSPPATQGGEGDVLEGGEVRQQVRALEDVGDPARAHRAARRARRASESGRPCHSTLAGRRLDQAAEHVQQRRLARARAAAAARRCRRGAIARSTPASARTAASPCAVDDGDVAAAASASRRPSASSRGPPVAELDHAVGGRRRRAASG